MGEGDDGMYDALTSFTANSFHVFPAALWGNNDPEQINAEEWMIGGKHYVAYVGNFGIRNSDGITVHVPASLFSEIEAVIKSELSRTIFIGFASTSVTWKIISLLRRLKTMRFGKKVYVASEERIWERRSGFYSVRLFAVLRVT